MKRHVHACPSLQIEYEPFDPGQFANADHYELTAELQNLNAYPVRVELNNFKISGGHDGDRERTGGPPTNGSSTGAASIQLAPGEKSSHAALSVEKCFRCAAPRVNSGFISCPPDRASYDVKVRFMPP